MSDTFSEPSEPQAQVNDRRRFDAEGNPRDDDDRERSSAEPVREPHPAEAEAARSRQELEIARRRVDELARAYQAVQADREKFEQRLTRERERLLDVERGNVAQALLEAVDELDRVLSVAGGDASSLAQGVRLIRDKLLAQAMTQGIERLDVVGRTFDPQFAEAADMMVTDDPESDQRILAEIRAGYRLRDRVIRPARVRVAKYVPPAQA